MSEKRSGRRYGCRIALLRDIEQAVYLTMNQLVLKRQISPRIANGHPWIYANEVDMVKGTITGGEIVEVRYHTGKFAGLGYVNPLSQIMVRLLTRKQEPIDAAFFL